MPDPGWYPDPGGRAGHYRLWDGQGWGLSTTPDPPGRPPNGPPAPRRPRHTGRRTAVAVAVAVVVVLAVVAAVVVRGANGPYADGGPSPTAPSPTAPPSAGPSPSSPSAVPSPSPSLSPSPSVATPSAAPCPVGNPFARQDHLRDGRVHGGSLSFPQQPGWTDPGEQASAFTWTYDLGETDVRVGPSGFAALAVGALSVADGFEDPQTAAELAMGCTVASAIYSNVTSRTNLVDEPTTVDGYRAWTLRSEIRTYDARTSYAGDTVQITVVDLGSPEALAFFWGSAPIGDEALGAQLDQAVDELRVD